LTTVRLLFGQTSEVVFGLVVGVALDGVEAVSVGLD
jgi:hypothetical protein